MQCLFFLQALRLLKAFKHILQNISFVRLLSSLVGSELPKLMARVQVKSPFFWKRKGLSTPPKKNGGVGFRTNPGSRMFLFIKMRAFVQRDKTNRMFLFI
jgi:hypothetical protein